MAVERIDEAEAGRKLGAMLGGAPVELLAVLGGPSGRFISAICTCRAILLLVDQYPQFSSSVLLAVLLAVDQVDQFSAISRSHRGHGSTTVDGAYAVAPILAQASMAACGLPFPLPPRASSPQLDWLPEPCGPLPFGR